MKLTWKPESVKFSKVWKPESLIMWKFECLTVCERQDMPFPGGVGGVWVGFVTGKKTKLQSEICSKAGSKGKTFSQWDIIFSEGLVINLAKVIIIWVHWFWFVSKCYTWVHWSLHSQPRPTEVGSHSKPEDKTYSTIKIILIFHILTTNIPNLLRIYCTVKRNHVNISSKLSFTFNIV